LLRRGRPGEAPLLARFEPITRDEPRDRTEAEFRTASARPSG